MQQSSIDFDKRKSEFKYFKRGIDKVLKGYNDEEFKDLFIAFINDLNFSQMTLDEKEIIFSHALKYNTISKQAQSFILNWFKARKIEPEIKQSP